MSGVQGPTFGQNLETSKMLKIILETIPKLAISNQWQTTKVQSLLQKNQKIANSFAIFVPYRPFTELQICKDARR